MKISRAFNLSDHVLNSHESISLIDKHVILAANLIQITGLVGLTCSASCKLWLTLCHIWVVAISPSRPCSLSITVNYFLLKFCFDNFFCTARCFSALWHMSRSLGNFVNVSLQRSCSPL